MGEVVPKRKYNVYARDKQKEQDVIDMVDELRGKVEDTGYAVEAVSANYPTEFDRARDFGRLIANDAIQADAFCLVMGYDYEQMMINVEASGEDKLNFRKKLDRLAYKYKRLELVREAINAVQLDVHIEFHDKHMVALNEQFKLGMTARSEKVRADALHQFIQNTRNPHLNKPDEQEMNQLSESKALLDSIANVFATVSGNRPRNPLDGNTGNPASIMGNDVTQNPPVETAQGEKPPNSIFTNSQNLQGADATIDYTPKDSL